MALNPKDLNLSDRTVNKVVDFLKDMWFGIPVWLRNLLVVIVAMGGGYFIYTRLTMSYDIDTLITEVSALNEKTSVSVIYDRYIYDISNLIQLNQNLENEVDLMYYYHEENMKILIEFMRKHHSTDPLIDDLERLHSLVVREKEVYDRTIKYHMSIYKDWKPKSQNVDVPKEYIKADD